MSSTAWPFIVHDTDGVAFIEASRTKVLDIVLDQLAYGWSAEQIHRQHSHLSLPQIHSALGYYHDHTEECDRQIADRRKRAEVILANVENPGLQHRLASLKAPR